jgi:hypothetical protein
MTLHELRHFLLWNTVVNYVVLITWFGALIGARDALYRLHTRWFELTRAQFDSLHYAGMAVYKVGILLFLLVPTLVLYVAT